MDILSCCTLAEAVLGKPAFAHIASFFSYSRLAETWHAGKCKHCTLERSISA
jgi:hypothetical protein